MEWDHQTFAHWLKYQRRVVNPISQERLAEALGVTQSNISRWEADKPNTEPPSLEECLALADIFQVNFIELAKLCGRWNDQIQRRVLVSLGDGDLSEAPVAQLDDLLILELAAVA